MTKHPVVCAFRKKALNNLPMPLGVDDADPDFDARPHMLESRAQSLLAEAIEAIIVDEGLPWSGAQTQFFLTTGAVPRVQPLRAEVTTGLSPTTRRLIVTADPAMPFDLVADLLSSIRGPLVGQVRLHKGADRLVRLGIIGIGLSAEPSAVARAHERWNKSQPAKWRIRDQAAFGQAVSDAEDWLTDPLLFADEKAAPTRVVVNSTVATQQELLVLDHAHVVLAFATKNRARK